MNDVTKHYRFQRILVEAAQYRTILQVLKTDPDVTPKTAALLRDVLAADRDDAASLKRWRGHDERSSNAKLSTDIPGALVCCPSPRNVPCTS
jgi:hypothetical protein